MSWRCTHYFFRLVLKFMWTENYFRTFTFFSRTYSISTKGRYADRHYLLVNSTYSIKACKCIIINKLCKSIQTQRRYPTTRGHLYLIASRTSMYVCWDDVLLHHVRGIDWPRCYPRGIILKVKSVALVTICRKGFVQKNLAEIFLQKKIWVANFYWSLAALFEQNS